MASIPHLDAQPSEPAREWAANPTPALGPDTNTTNIATLNPTTAQLFEERNMRPGTTAEEIMSHSSVVSTPGHEFPGAYPDKQYVQPAGSGAAPTMSDTASRVAQSVQRTAQTYGPMAAEKIGQYLPKSVADKVSQYTGVPNPQGTVIASEHDQPHVKSMPPTELTGSGVREHVGGAGALPGLILENGVTRLPEERNTSAEYPTNAGATVIAQEMPQDVAQSMRNTSQHTRSGVTGNTHSTAVTASTLPSREWDGAQPGDHSSGVGALPGPVDEPAVAVLPGEGGRGITNATFSGVGTHARTFGGATLPSHDDELRGGVSGGVGTLPGHIDESSVARFPGERSAEGAGKSVRWKKDAEFAGAGAAATGMALDGQNNDQVRGALNPKTGEDTTMADAAHSAGLRSADAQQPMTKQEQKYEGKAGAAAIGAAVGDQYAKDRNSNKNETNQEAKHATPHGQTKQEKKQEGNVGAAAVGAAAGEQYAKEHHHNKDEKKADKGPHGGKDKQASSSATDYHPAELHPPSEDSSKEHAKHESEKQTAGEKEQEAPLTKAKHADSKVDSHAPGTGSATDNDNAEEGQGHKAKKAGFMAKMKGEAMVLLGKVEGKKGQERVEQGQRLKAGEDISPH